MWAVKSTRLLTNPCTASRAKHQGLVTSCNATSFVDYNALDADIIKRKISSRDVTNERTR